MYKGPHERGPDNLIDRQDLLKAYMTAHHPGDIAVLVRVEKQYNEEEGDFELPSEFSHVAGPVSREIIAESEYLLFVFKDEGKANEYIESLTDLLHAELWVKGSCVSEV